MKQLSTVPPMRIIIASLLSRTFTKSHSRINTRRISVGSDGDEYRFNPIAHEQGTDYAKDLNPGRQPA